MQFISYNAFCYIRIRRVPLNTSIERSCLFFLHPRCFYTGEMFREDKKLRCIYYNIKDDSCSKRSKPKSKLWRMKGIFYMEDSTWINFRDYDRVIKIYVLVNEKKSAKFHKPLWYNKIISQKINSLTIYSIAFYVIFDKI